MAGQAGPTPQAARLSYPDRTQAAPYDGAKFNASDSNGIKVAVNQHAQLIEQLFAAQVPPETLAFNPTLATGYFGPNSSGSGASVVSHAQAGVTEFYSCKVRITPALFGGTMPAPATGGADDSYWKLASPPAAAYQPAQDVTPAGLRALLAPQLGGEGSLGPGRLYRVQRGSVGDVWVRALSASLLDPDAVWYDAAAEVLKVGTYTPATGQFVEGGAGVSVLQTTGTSTTAVMSQDAVTAALLTLENDLTGLENDVNALENDPRLNDARRVVSALSTNGEFFIGADNDLALPVAAFNEHATFNINQRTGLVGNLTLKRGSIVTGKYRSFRLQGQTLTLAQDGFLDRLKIEDFGTNGLTGRVSSLYQADNTGTPRITNCLLYAGEYHTGPGAFLRVIGGDIAVDNWNRGSGKIYLENNVREWGTRGSGAGFCEVEVRGTASGTPANDSVTEPMLAPAVRDKLNAAPGGAGVDPNGITTKKVSTGATELTLEQTGDAYGGSRLELLSRNGSAGARFSAIPGPQNGAGLDLVDFAFVAISGNQKNLRFEKRSSALLRTANAQGELQIIDDAHVGAGLISAAFGDTVATLRTDLDLSDAAYGIVLRSPGGTRYKLTVSDAGQPVFTAV